jgi:hypothetical protein
MQIVWSWPDPYRLLAGLFRYLADALKAKDEEKMPVPVFVFLCDSIWNRLPVSKIIPEDWQQLTAITKYGGLEAMCQLLVTYRPAIPWYQQAISTGTRLGLWIHTVCKTLVTLMHNDTGLALTLHWPPLPEDQLHPFSKQAFQRQLWRRTKSGQVVPKKKVSKPVLIHQVLATLGDIACEMGSAERMITIVLTAMCEFTESKRWTRWMTSMYDGRFPQILSFIAHTGGDSSISAFRLLASFILDDPRHPQRQQHILGLFLTALSLRWMKLKGGVNSPEEVVYTLKALANIIWRSKLASDSIISTSMSSLPRAYMLKVQPEMHLLQPPIGDLWGTKGLSVQGLSLSDVIAVETGTGGLNAEEIKQDAGDIAKGKGSPFLSFLLLLADSLHADIARAARDVLRLALGWHQKEWRDVPDLKRFGFYVVQIPSLTNNMVKEEVKVDPSLRARTAELQKSLGWTASSSSRVYPKDALTLEEPYVRVQWRHCSGPGCPKRERMPGSRESDLSLYLSATKAAAAEGKQASGSSSHQPQQPPFLKCGKCLQRFYCCVQCQKNDWKAGHKIGCFAPVS